MLKNEILTYEELVTLWGLLCRIAGSASASEMIQQIWSEEEDEERRKELLAILENLRDKIDSVMAREAQLLVVQLPASERTKNDVS
jgi:hypothetical protein